MAIDDLRTISTALGILRQTTAPSGMILSVYLDTSTRQIDHLAYLLAYRNHRKARAAEIPKAEREPFEAAADQVEAYLAGEFAPRAPGLALFAGSTAESFFAVPLPSRPAETMIWNCQPYVEPLLAVLDDYERLAVVLFDSRSARLFRIYLGTIEEQQTIEDDVPSKQQGGGWAALQQSRYARHRDDHLLRHTRRVIATLGGWLRTQPFDRLFIAGPAEPLSVLKLQLPRPLRDRLSGTLGLELFATETEVLCAVSRAQEDAERQDELAKVEELIETRTGYTALGVEPVLTALTEGRVHVLLIADTLGAVGAECPSCGTLARWAERCPTCGGMMKPVGDLKERAIERALSEGAKIEVVSGPAAEHLLAHGGLAAWTRY